MIFDRLCGIVERHLPELEGVLRSCRLFVYEKPAHEGTPSAIPPEQALWLQENFFLPFHCVAAEDPGSVVVFEDEEPEARGLGASRRFWECMPVDADHRAFADGTPHQEFLGEEGLSDAVLVSQGRISMEQVIPGRRFDVKGGLERILAATKERVLLDASGDDIPSDLAAAALKNASAGLQELMLLNTPDRFVVEVMPAVPGRTKEKKIPRSDSRPLYTLLRPDEIRRVMGVPEPAGDGRSSPRPHERRRHVRTYRSDRYVEMRGRTVIIPATWVGPSEAVSGGKRYRVLLDV